MGVPLEAPQAVHNHWAAMPNCGDIVFRFKPFGIGPVIRVKCQGWGQIQNDSAATRQVISHILNKQTLWWAYYDGWESVGYFDPKWSKAGGGRPVDFAEMLQKEVDDRKRRYGH